MAVFDNLTNENIKTYSALDQIGMSTDNTITEVMTALPINSELVISMGSVNSNLSADLPNGTEKGELKLTKGGNNSRGIADFKSYSSNRLHTNRYNDGVFKGWRKLAEQSDLDTKLSLSGGQITGNIIGTDNGFKIAAGGDIYSDKWGSIWLSTALARLLPLVGGTLTGDLYAPRFISSDRAIGADKNSFSNATVSVNTPYETNNACRAGYGFHNVGLNGTYLYLDTDSTLKHVDNGGNYRTLMDSRNFSYDENTQTLNITL